MSGADLLLTVVSRTPLWVWPLLVLLLALGVRDLRHRWVRPWQPVILAIVFPLISAGNALAAPIAAGPALAVLVAGLFLTAVPGWFLAPVRRMTADPERRRALLPGSFVTLAVIVAVFALRYYFGYLFGRYPELRDDALTNALAIGLPALVSGFIVGRNVRLAHTAQRLLTNDSD
jgi:hypothetical protein